MAISTCCGCCSLQKGSIVIGFLFFICDAAAVIYLGTILSRLFSVSDDWNVQFFVLRATTLGLILYTIILLIITGVFIVGAINRNVNYVFLFVSMSFGNIIVSISYFFYNAVLIFISPHITIIFIVIFFISAAIGMSIHFYLWYVVYNFYQELIIDKFRKTFQPNTINYAQPVIPGMVYSS